MKHPILNDILKKLKENPQLIRKIKVFAVVGVVGLFVTGGLLLWAAVSAFNFVASKANQAVNLPVAQERLEAIKTQARALPNVIVLDCWGKAQSLFAIQPWLERPALENLLNLKTACLEPPVSADGEKTNNTIREGK